MTAASDVIRVVDADAPADLELPSVTALAPPVVAVADDPERLASTHWLDIASFTLTERPTSDPRCVRVDSIDVAVADLTARIAAAPVSAAVNADVFASVDTAGDPRRALVTESLAYSTLQSGSEFRRWADQRGPVRIEPPTQTPPVLYRRAGSALHITFNRPHRHNAFTDSMRAILLEALTVAAHDPTITSISLRGAGRSFCSGGDLAEFGAFADPAAAHLARTRHSPALGLDLLRRRLGTSTRAYLHGQVLGSGLEMASFCGHLTADPHARFGLPELSVGLIPGAGGTYSVPRRIGRWRSCYLVLSGAVLDAGTALEWGLVDAIEACAPA
ncbi:enoyl-CoA hydratase/isomerase family protein [Gordonia sp. ABSL1-1]|uniref:enoyl-CoA hydratase/isomerase family protein n=1 Tax=Gordonia sp. ABSL1-1 TaxID=3053923 RepID=UPI002573950B|nr:enoyl-CoA hydratase/isomerase family protein [Gordonia sp. ABSL1-1]MDL9936212.1 enoyl-CoA hydratase/isomerase family protein [Gordonia sp. ABSL1-1]